MKIATNIGFLIFFLLFDISNTLAWADDNAKADAILAKLEDGSIVAEHHLQAYIDEAEALISPDDQARTARLLQAKCWVHSFSDEQEIEKAIAFANHWISQDKVAAYPKTKIDLLLCKSWFQEQKGDMDAALSGYQTALLQAKRINDQRFIADAYSLIGELMSFQGDYSTALANLIKAQEIYQTLQYGHWQLFNLTAIATSYRRFGDPKSAIHYYEKVLKIYREEVDQTQAMQIQRAIAFSLEELGLYQEAVDKHLANYQYYRQHNKRLEQAISATEIAGALIQLNEIAEAGLYLEEARPQITSTVNNTINHFYYYFAQVLQAKKEFDEALSHLEIALKGFEQDKNDRYFPLALQLKGQILASQGQWQQAYHVQTQFFKKHQELDKIQISKNTAEMRHKFDLDQIEEENKQLLEYKRLKENEKLILEQNKQLQALVLFLAVIIIFYLTYSVYKQRQKSRNLETLALTDHLTQLPNRRHMYKWGNSQLQQARHKQSPLSIILFDADHFKKINDALGHEEGDNTLKQLAKLSISLMRKQDKVGRIGGEEFLVILSDTPKEQALTIAQRFVSAVDNELAQSLHDDNKLTISAGVASLDENNSQDSLDAMINRADKALYHAKSAGRNCARLSET